MNEMNVTAKCIRTQNWWAVEVPEVPGVFTQARRLDQVVDQTKDAVATMLEVDPSSVNVAIEHDAAGVAEVRELQWQARAMSQNASAAMTQLVGQLRDDGFTMRDIGVMLDVSPQRAQQLAARASNKIPDAP
jgi:predicted RNase H-like HicB family nuclease